MSFRRFFGVPEAPGVRRSERVFTAGAPCHVPVHRGLRVPTEPSDAIFYRSWNRVGERESV
eukprot:2184891-Prymnesium_polylepis.2